MNVQCGSSPLSGGRCELESGHDGKHSKTTRFWHADCSPEVYGTVSGVFEWDDVSQSGLASQFGGLA